MDKDADGDTLLESFEKWNHRVLLGNTGLAGGFPKTLKERGQTIILETLHQDQAIVPAKAVVRAGPFEVSEVDRHPDHRSRSLGRQYGLKQFFVFDCDVLTDVAGGQPRCPE